MAHPGSESTQFPAQPERPRYSAHDPNQYDVIVVGLGAMGCAAAYQLAKKNTRVLGIDQYRPPHTLGSSHGETRITRRSIGEGEHYVPLVARSHEIWSELEAQSGRQLFVPCGGLFLSDPDHAGEFHGKQDFVSQTISLAQEYGVQHEVLDRDEIMRRFPMFRLTGNEVGYFEPGAGILRVEQCIETQLEAATHLGAELHYDERVTAIDVVGDEQVTVVTDSGRYRAAKVIIAAGAWVRQFLPPALHAPFKITRQVFFWFEAEEIAQWRPQRFPVFIWVGRSLEDLFYGMPGVGGAGQGVKVGSEAHIGHDSPEAVQREVGPDEIEQIYARYIRNRLAGLTANCLHTATCLYTETPDGDFVIDNHPVHPNILVASPCSGHGFKHSAAIGEILAELALTGESRSDLERMRLARFSALQSTKLGQ